MTELVTENRGYQKPRPGEKLKDDVLRLIAALDAIDGDVAALLLALADKSNVGHGHAMEAVTGLIAALSNKLDVGFHDTLANLTDVDVAGAANGMALLRQASKWIPVALQIGNILGLETALNGKATSADLATALAGKVDKVGDASIAGSVSITGSFDTASSVRIGVNDPAGLFIVAAEAVGGGTAPYIVAKKADNSGWEFSIPLRFDRVNRRWAIGSSPIWHSGNFDPSQKLDVSAYSAADVLAKLLTVDANESGLNANTVQGWNAAGLLALANATGTLAASKSALRPDITDGVGSYCVAIYTVAPASPQQIGNTYAGSTLGDPTNTGLRYFSGSWRNMGYIGMSGGSAVHLWQRYA